MGYLVDSNVLIDYVAERFSPQQLHKLDLIFDEELNVSLITKIEVLGFNAPEEEGKKLQQFFSVANIKTLSEEITRITIEIRKANRIKIPDAIIAATAIFFNYSLLSRNQADFASISALKVIDPYSL